MQKVLAKNKGEYLVDIGRYGSAIIQFAVLTEYLINYQLRLHSLIDGGGKYNKTLQIECNSQWKELGNNGRASFSYSKYFYGLSKLGFVLDQELLEAIQEVYDLRNKLAHGFNVFNAFEICKIEFERETVTEFNAWNCLMTISNYMTEVYNFFSDNFEDQENT